MTCTRIQIPPKTTSPVITGSIFGHDMIVKAMSDATIPQIIDVATVKMNDSIRVY
jgi:hypothetical protein